jgi:hypothetical protein
MANTLKLIKTHTVGSGGESIITFNNIPQTFTDLMILGSVKTSRNAANDFIKGYFNSDTTDGNYAGFLNYNTTGAISGVSFAGASAPRYFGDVPGNSVGVATMFSQTRIWINGYSDSNTKSYGSESGQNSAVSGTTQLLTYSQGRWAGTSAITSISFTCGVTGPWVEFSTMSLYGIQGSN